MSRSPLLALAHVHRVVTRVGGRPCDVFVFDHHRQAFPLWCHAAALAGPLTLVSLDRHFDLEPPKAAAPDHRAPLEELDSFARTQLAPSNDDHVRAAMDSGAVEGALIVARSHWPKDLRPGEPVRDRAGRLHPIASAPHLDALGESHLRAIASGPIALDIDLDCFTTLSDGHVDEVVAWDDELIESFLFPPDWQRFWSPVLERTLVVTLAREPFHCGGLAAGARLWERFSRVFFGRLLGVPSP